MPRWRRFPTSRRFGNHATEQRREVHEAGVETKTCDASACVDSRLTIDSTAHGRCPPLLWGIPGARPRGSVYTAALPTAVWLGRNDSTEPLQFCSRNESSAQNDGRHAARVGDVCQRVRLEHDQPGLLAHFDGPFIRNASDELSGVPS
jgi:hypothetical protein